MEFFKGADVYHPDYGRGTITQVDPDGVRFSALFDNLHLRSVPIETYQKILVLDKRQLFTEQEENANSKCVTDESIRELLREVSRDLLISSSRIEPDRPNQNDLNLVNVWQEGSACKDDSDWARLYSARLAEKAVIKYYEREGFVVRDISASQLVRPNSGEWKTHDIETNEICIDVKNARQSEINPLSYVSHCLPNFKQNRDGKGVWIAGVISPWLTRSELVDECLPELLSRDTYIRFLGLTHETRLKDLANMMGNGTLDFSGCDRFSDAQFLPAWIFDYPDFAYKKRDQNLREFKRLAEGGAISFHFQDASMVRALIAAGIDNLPTELFAHDWQWTLANRLVHRINRYGLSLPVLYLSLLEHFLEMVASESVDDFNPSGYRSLIFPIAQKPDVHQKRPLYLFDPLASIDCLIDSLSTLWKGRSNGLLRFRSFKLQRLNILSGRCESSEPWTTLLAYCGGWIQGRFGPKRCGNTPLVWGNCRTCSCRRLVCPKCHFCDQACGECSSQPIAFPKLR